jgi:hypothetical protein
LGLFFKFANTFTEKTVQHGFLKQIQEYESKETVHKMKRLGYTDEDIAKMDLRDESE